VTGTPDRPVEAAEAGVPAHPGRLSEAGVVPALVPRVCQVWWARPADVGRDADALLAPADLERRARLVHVADRQRLTAAWALTRTVLGAAVGASPTVLQIDRTCPECGGRHGKPRLLDDRNVQFSVSHSGDRVAVAVQRGAPVGVDVEKIGRFAAGQLDLLADHVLAAEERAELRRWPPSARPAAFTTYWTRKEAVLKATGEGLGEAVVSTVVSPPSSPPRLLRRGVPAGRTALPIGLHALLAPPGYVATLAVAGPEPSSVVERDASVVLRNAMLRAAARGPDAT
jgi:4'-phosphopantetheinyl transferase